MTAPRKYTKKPRLMPPAGFGFAAVAASLIAYLDPFSLGFGGFWSWIGAALVIAGFILNVLGDRKFTRTGTTIKPFGQTTALVTDGVFSLSRNPMYLGMALALAGIAAIGGSALALLPNVVFLWWVSKNFIQAEEKKLEREFGTPYRGYKARVRRWI